MTLAWKKVRQRKVTLPGFDFEPAEECGKMTHPTLPMRWLPYFGGVITAEITEVFAITGPFSGCLCSIFKFKGTVYLGHLGTIGGVPNEAGINTNMKKAWTAATQLKDFEVIIMWNPLKETVAAEDKHKKAKKWDPKIAVKASHIYAGAVKDGNNYKPYTVTFASIKRSVDKTKNQHVDVLTGMQFLGPTLVS